MAAPDGGDWVGRGQTLSDKRACEELGLTREEIFEAIRDGKLQYRQGSVHGNPWLRLLRREVEAFVEEKHGQAHLGRRRAEAELARVNRDLRALKRQIAVLEARKAELLGRVQVTGRQR